MTHTTDPVLDFLEAASVPRDAWHATIDGANAGGTAFRTTSGADLTLAGLTFRNAPGEGVRVDVPAGATGTIHITLHDVDIVNHLGHGGLVNEAGEALCPSGATLKTADEGVRNIPRSVGGANLGVAAIISTVRSLTNATIRQLPPK